MATRTTTTRTTGTARGPSADPSAAPYSFELLAQAYADCRRNKRRTRSALAFERHLERNLCSLHEEIASGHYKPGRSVCFVVTHPKPREVWAADFRDRIVHHLLYNHIAPRFERAFSAASCACIPGRGTLYAAQRLEHLVRSITRNWATPAHYLKCDLANFFVSIDKHVLRAQLARRVHDPWWMALADTILYHDPRTDVEVHGRPDRLRLVPAHKSLFNAPADTGLPIGNLSSQFFANAHLDALDQFVHHRLRVRHYVRYVDDFVLLHPSAQILSEHLRAIDAFLPARLHAQLNPRKTIQQPVDRGVHFVGHVIKPWRRTTRRHVVATALRRIEHADHAVLHATVNSYLGLVRQATHSHADQARIARAVLRRGRCVDAALTKMYARTR